MSPGGHSAGANTSIGTKIGVGTASGVAGRRGSASWEPYVSLRQRSFSLLYQALMKAADTSQ